MPSLKVGGKSREYFFRKDEDYEAFERILGDCLVLPDTQPLANAPAAEPRPEDERHLR